MDKLLHEVARLLNIWSFNLWFWTNVWSDGIIWNKLYLRWFQLWYGSDLVQPIHELLKKTCLMPQSLILVPQFTLSWLNVLFINQGITLKYVNMEFLDAIASLDWGYESESRFCKRRKTFFYFWDLVVLQ